jgi:hypothetical protein
LERIREMKTACGTVLILTMAATILFTALPCLAVEKKGEEKVWLKDKPKQSYEWFELTDEKIEHIMAWLAENDPEKAKELAQLKKEDPEKFKVELKKVKQEKYGKYDEKHWEGQKLHSEKDMPMAGPGGPGGGRREMIRERMFSGPDEYLEWLGKNYPEEAEKLAELKDKEPELYRKHLGSGYRKYRRIIEMEEENPQLAEVLKQDLELKIKRDKLLRTIRVETDETQKEKSVKELTEVIGNRFDLIVKRKQIRYEQMSQELKRLEKEVARSSAEIEKWKEMKEEKVKEHLEELISQTEKFKWD